MNAEEFIPYIGKTDDSTEVQELLSRLGTTRKPKLKKGELYDHTKFLKQGFVLVFRESEDPKTSQLVLADVQIFSDAEHGFKSFDGELPGGIVFSDTRAEVRKKLGKPTRSKDMLRKDFWDKKGYIRTVQYARDTGQIQMVSLAAPIKY